MKRLYTAVTTAFVAAALAASTPGCSKEEPPPSGAAAGSLPKTAPESVATRVEAATLDNVEAASRIIRPAEVQGGKEADLASALGGFVEAVLIESGDAVKKNQVIARVDTGTYSTQVDLAKVEVEDAQRELDRLRKLGKAVASSRTDAADTRVRRAKAQLRLAQINATRTIIRAPFAGVVSNLLIERGEVVPPGGPIGKLVQLDPAVMTVSVTDEDVGSLKLGDAAGAMTTGSASPIPGKVSKIEPVADPRTRTFLVEVEVANPKGRLLPGMIAAVEFRRQVRADLLHIPQDFIVTRLEGNGVFLIGGDGRARWKTLELGEVVGNLVQVISGVERGDRIVVTGHRSLANGDELIVTREGACCVDGRVDFGVTPDGIINDKAAPTAAETKGEDGEAAVVKKAAKPASAKGSDK